MTDSLISTNTESAEESARLHVSARTPRPMLARVADAVYWMARYIERSEHVARALLVNTDLLTDVGDMTPQLRQRLWETLLEITYSDPAAVMQGKTADADDVVPPYMTFDTANSNALLSCLTKARENARSIRENISADMWECLNTLYWTLRSEETQARFAESPLEVYKLVMDGSMLFQGLTDETMQHGQPWLFTQVGKYLERIDITCRILEVKFNTLRAVESQLEGPLQNMHWIAVLRSCGAVEAYKRMYVGELDPLRVASFIVFEPSLPRSIRYAVYHAQECAARIRALANPALVDGADRILGRLNAELEYADPETLLRSGLSTFLQSVRQAVGQAALATQKAYFLA